MSADVAVAGSWSAGDNAEGGLRRAAIAMSFDRSRSARLIRPTNYATNLRTAKKQGGILKNTLTAIKTLFLSIIGLIVLVLIFFMPIFNEFYGPTSYRPAESLFVALFKWDDKDWANFKTKWSPYGLTYLNTEVADLDLECFLSNYVARKTDRWKWSYTDLNITSKTTTDTPIKVYLKTRKSKENPSKFQMAFDKNYSEPVLPKYATPQNFDGGSKDMYCMRMVADETYKNGTRHFYCEQYFEPNSGTLTILLKTDNNEIKVSTGNCKPFKNE